MRTHQPKQRTENDRRRKSYEPKTRFQEWLKPHLESRDWLYTDLFRELAQRGFDVGENYVYRIVRGDPEKFRNAARPGYELALEIGRILGDIDGALEAAEYPPQTESAPYQILPSGIRVVAIGPDGKPVRLSNDGLRLVDPHFVIAKERAESN